MCIRDRYWTCGVQAACAVNKTNENRVYDGELTVDVDYTQEQLARAVRSGKFMFHRVGDDVRVLMDINTLVTFTEEKKDDFSNNQTVRVLDQIGNDIASMFNTKYLGIMPNDDAGRVSLWNDIVTYNKELARLRAIEDVESKEITVERGNLSLIHISVTFLGPGGRLLQAIDSAEKFSFKRKSV